MGDDHDSTLADVDFEDVYDHVDDFINFESKDESTMNVNIHDSPNNDLTLHPRRQLNSDVASHDKSTMNVSINCSPLTILPSAKRTLTDDIPEGDNETRWIPWDYIPRDKITTEHVVRILGKKRLKQSNIGKEMSNNRLKHSNIGKEMNEIKALKDSFLSFARPKVLSGYVDATVQLGWTINGGQNITNWDGIKEFIKTSIWSEQFEHDLHYLQYRRFKVKPEFYNWDGRLDAEFRKSHNIQYYGIRKAKSRGCLTTLATSIKTDYNQRIRRLCSQVHERFLKERQDNHCGRRARVKDYKFNPTFVRNYEPVIEDNGHDQKMEEIEELKRHLEELKKENASLKQVNANVSEI